MQIFEHVGRTVERMDRLLVLGIFAQTMKQRLHGVQIFIRFRREIRQNFGIESRN